MALGAGRLDQAELGAGITLVAGAGRGGDAHAMRELKAQLAAYHRLAGNPPGTGSKRNSRSRPVSVRR